MTTTQKIAYYILLVLTSVLFIFSGYSKLVAVPQAVAGFQTAHLPIWLMYFIGVCEILGAIGLWMALGSNRIAQKLATWATYGLFIILAGAVVVSVIFVDVPTALFPLVVGLVLWTIVWLGKKRMKLMTNVQQSNLL
jgi:uncharacterized membrane protein YphA (DoxX/SURF4 family)